MREQVRHSVERRHREYRALTHRREVIEQAVDHRLAGKVSQHVSGQREGAFRQLAMAVDTHIFRVSNRTGIAPGKNVVEVEKKLLKFVPKDYLLDAHHWLILHGRYVCVARKPRCGSCRIEDLCEYREKTSND